MLCPICPRTPLLLAGLAVANRRQHSDRGPCRAHRRHWGPSGSSRRPGFPDPRQLAARPRAHLAYGAHGAHVALVPGAELRRREQPRGVEAVEASVDGDLTDGPQVTVAPDLEFGGVLVGNPGGEQRRVCVECCSTEEAGVR